MKRLIAVLLVMGVIMTAFAATGSAGKKELTNIEKKAADTEVVLTLNQNIGVVWFSTSTGEVVRRYNLTLPSYNAVSENISGNSDWTASGSDLYLNWNIISKNDVEISLQISSPMVGDSSSDNKIGWTVSWYPTSTESPTVGSTASISRTPTQEGVVSAVAYTKNGTAYGNASQKQLWIFTENTYGKTIDTYRADLIATIKTI